MAHAQIRCYPETKSKVSASNTHVTISYDVTLLPHGKTGIGEFAFAVVYRGVDNF